MLYFSLEMPGHIKL